MAFRRFLCLRALLLVLVVAFGQAGFAFASAAMAMPCDRGSMPAMSAMATDMCPGCSATSQSTTKLSSCSESVCSAVVAVLPMLATGIAVVPRATFAAPVSKVEHGITVTPDPGPPRSTLLP